MKKLILLAMMAAVPASASTESVYDPISCGPQFSRQEFFGGLDFERDGIYQLKKDATVNFTKADKTPSKLTFSTNESIAVKFKNGLAQLTLSPGPKEKDVPSRIVISRKEYLGMPVQFRANGGPKDLAAFASPLASTKVAGPAQAYGRMHFMGAQGCVAYVLKAIHWDGGRSGNGVEMTRTLASRGWHSVSCASPPEGAVASWSGGGGAGHTAIWRNGCWAYDLDCGDPGSRYHLLNCVAP